MPDYIGYISESGLTNLIFEFASVRAPGISRVVLDFAAPDAMGCNWRVAGIASGRVPREDAASAIFDVAERNRTKWIMVPDGSALDGRIVRRDRAIFAAYQSRHPDRPLFAGFGEDEWDRPGWAV